jgi:hypothetical protein
MDTAAISPKSAAKAVSNLVKGAYVRDNHSAYKGLLYFPVKVGNSSPITVYEETRGQFTGDCTVIVAFGRDADQDVKAKFAAYAAANGLEVASDPGDANKKGWKMKCSQVLAACEHSAPTPAQTVTASVQNPGLDVDALLKDPAVRAKLLAALLGS